MVGYPKCVTSVPVGYHLLISKVIPLKQDRHRWFSLIFESPEMFFNQFPIPPRPPAPDAPSFIFAAPNIANGTPKRIPPRNGGGSPEHATSGANGEDSNRTKLREDEEEAKLAMLWTDKA